MDGVDIDFAQFRAAVNPDFWHFHMDMTKYCKMTLFCDRGDGTV